MRARAAQYLNEIVSLTVMALMCLALISGQAAGSVPERELELASGADISWVVEPAKLRIDIDFSFRHTGE